MLEGILKGILFQPRHLPLSQIAPSPSNLVLDIPGMGQPHFHRDGWVRDAKKSGIVSWKSSRNLWMSIPKCSQLPWKTGAFLLCDPSPTGGSIRQTFGCSGHGLEKGWNLRKAEEKTSLDPRNIQSIKNGRGMRFV